jgi:GMP synthase (glutamine-hydrolysing)
LKAAGCAIVPLEAYDLSASWPKLDEFQGIVSMGGPMSANELEKYPFLAKEMKLLEEALDHNIPILGICLGSQMLAQALGGWVEQNREEEIGWYPINLEAGVYGDPMFEAFKENETVFHLHSDTFSLPDGAVHLASSELCDNQAFRYGNNVYGLQFHVEVTDAMIRAWLRGPNKTKKSGKLYAKMDAEIREQTPKNIERLHQLSDHVGKVFGSLCSN